MKKPRKPTARQLRGALDTLLQVTETETLTGEQRDEIARARHLLWDLVHAREAGS